MLPSWSADRRWHHRRRGRPRIDRIGNQEDRDPVAHSRHPLERFLSRPVVLPKADQRARRPAFGSRVNGRGARWGSVAERVMRRRELKRAIDVLGAAAGLLVLAPIMTIVAIGVRWRLGSPVLFRQRRIGLGGRPFTILKFRTMLDQRDASGELLRSAHRLDPFGQWLRSTSLDELPELFNVLRGDMSLVGPRPLIWRYHDRFTPSQARRHEAKPGITGWAQVHGRNQLTWQQRFELDVWYVDHWNVWLDLKVLARTALLVVRREATSPAEGEIMEEFLGTAGKKSSSRDSQD